MRASVTNMPSRPKNPKRSPKLPRKRSKRKTSRAQSNRRKMRTPSLNRLSYKGAGEHRYRGKDEEVVLTDNIHMLNAQIKRMTTQLTTMKQQNQTLQQSISELEAVIQKKKEEVSTDTMKLNALNEPLQMLARKWVLENNIVRHKSNNFRLSIRLWPDLRSKQELVDQEQSDFDQLTEEQQVKLHLWPEDQLDTLLQKNFEERQTLLSETVVTVNGTTLSTFKEWKAWEEAEEKEAEEKEAAEKEAAEKEAAEKEAKANSPPP